jgi:hypothetical protein
MSKNQNQKKVLEKFTIIYNKSFKVLKEEWSCLFTQNWIAVVLCAELVC